MNKLYIVFLCVLLAFSAAMSQTVSIMPHGISPAQMKADTLGDADYVGIFDRTYSGILNVGVETQTYLKGMSDVQLVAPTWTVVTKPNNSNADIAKTADVDTSTQFAVFTPDVVGTYVIEFADGGEPASVTINAAKYIGFQDGNCSLCHSGIASDWRETGHADFFTRALDGEVSSHYSESCISCHVVGYDLDADNDGFDDFAFEFPATLEAGTADAMVAQYPNAMKRANIQCEACHGPAGSHYGITEDNKMVAPLASQACNVCHDDDHYHVYPSQWKTAGHANIPSYPGGSRTTCRGCHNGAQFVQYVEGETITVQDHVDITCAVCHDPHSAENENQLRTLDATLSNDMMVSGVGKGALCMNCHQSRQEANSYTEQPSGHFGPHYAPQADMLLGVNVVTFGKTLPVSPHLEATGDACVTCHMYEGSNGGHDAEGNLTTAGMHSFSMVSAGGVDNVAACSDCHGDVGETFAEKKYFLNGIADHDGDGVDEGLQEEVHGLMDVLAEMLPHAADVEAFDPHDDPDSTWTKTELKAAFNHKMVYYDHSYGIHNPAFTVSLLKVSIQALMNNAIDGDIVAIDDVPNDQGKQVRIIWSKFVDDGTAIDPVNTYIVKRWDVDKEVWVGVGEHTADGSMRYAMVVPTVYDSTAMGDGMTSFKVVAVTQGSNVHESLPADGYSVDNLVPMAPTNVMANIVSGQVQITWDEPVDTDFKYFAVYRSDASGFEPTESNLVGTITGTQFTDMEISQNETYYYKVSAIDFSGNESTHSEVSILITAIEGEGGSVPTTFSLAQNYPNPFNPTTMIEFGVPRAEQVTIRIYDIRGSLVRTLADGKFAAGFHNVIWDGRNESGLLVSAGTYLYRLESPTTNFTKKMIFLK